jgi:hypothetical protein
MSVDSTGRRATRIAKLFVDLTWWVGLTLSALLIVVVLTAPLLERWGYAARFGWNNFHIENGREPPALVVRVASPASGQHAVPADSTQARIEPSPVASLQLPTRSWPLLFAGSATVIVNVAAMLWGVYLLRRFLADVLSGETFTTRNARRLSRLGWLVIVVAILGPQVERLRTWIILDRAEVTDALFVPADTNAGAMWLVGVLALVLAAAWRHGADLQQQSDLTV